MVNHEICNRFKSEVDHDVAMLTKSAALLGTSGSALIFHGFFLLQSKSILMKVVGYIHP